MRIISLDLMLRAPMLVVEHESQVVYRKTVPSAGRRVSEVQGVLAALDLEEEQQHELVRLFLNTASAVTPEVAKQVDGLLAASTATSFATVDPSRLPDSRAGWIWMLLSTPTSTTVDLRSGYLGTLYGFGLVAGALVWSGP